MAYITFVVLSALQKLKIRLRAIKDARLNHMAVDDLKVAIISLLSLAGCGRDAQHPSFFTRVGRSVGLSDPAPRPTPLRAHRG